MLRDIQKAGSVQLRISYDLDTGAQVRRRYDDLSSPPTCSPTRLSPRPGSRRSSTGRGDLVRHFPSDISGWKLVDAYLTVTDDGQQWAENAEKYGEEYADRYAEESSGGPGGRPAGGLATCWPPCSPT